jgi:hypothetical protein
LRAVFCLDGIQKHIRYYDDEEAAALAYVQALADDGFYDYVASCPMTQSRKNNV